MYYTQTCKRKEYDRKLFFKSATMLVVYSVVMFVLGQMAQYFNINNFIISLIIYWLYIPMEIFSIIISVLARLSTAETINWIYAIPSLFAPYLFVLFGKKSLGND